MENIIPIIKSAKNNIWLRPTTTVILTPIIEPVILSLEEHFKKAGVAAMVTSGLRDAYSQLRVISTYLTKNNLEKKYPEVFTCTPTDMNGNDYVWQMGWSALLNIGIIISPPLGAKCLMHTTFDKRDRFGSFIPQTPHAKGVAFDIGGGKTGIEPATKIMMEAWKNKLPGLVRVLPEHGNNAVHCECVKIS